MNRTIVQFLASTADAKDVTDLNIAAGIALAELEPNVPPRPLHARLKKIGATVATFVAFTVVGDTFAASPVHAGISPIRTEHVFTRVGAPDWGDVANADFFGHRLPWRAHNGWLERLLGG